MTPHQGDSMPVLLPQVGKYLTTKLPEILASMREKEEKLPDENVYWTHVRLPRRKPKVLTHEAFIYMLEYHLSLLLDKEGFRGVFVNGVVKTRIFTIRWHALPATAKTGEIAA